MNKLIKKIESAAQKQDFWGVVSLRKDDETLIHQSYGFREKSNQVMNSTDTAFGLASGTKSFTSVAIGVLMDHKKLTLESTMLDLLGQKYSFIDPGATIKNLLEHTSGMYDYYDEETVEDFDNYRVEIPWCYLENPSDYWPLFTGKSPKFNPGKRFSYSNGGYVLLGIIIERISGMLYRDFMTKYVLEPSGMKNSGFYSFNDLPANTALGYTSVEGQLVSNIYHLPIRGGGDGGMYSTSDDIHRFWKAFLSGKILSKETLKGYLQSQVKISEKCDYSFGYYLPSSDSGTSLLMEGCDVGIGFKSKYILKENLTLTVISNKTEGEKEIFRILDEALN
ncbi:MULTISPECIES: serine hydrolase [unclassified Oceanispirochaeta]|uniref:serine hydrolase domain-containing protein n=1 Tax=unclassified Oceanispirochaeta TaxID=2635722 RepID=UPI000E0992A9|nr:MULTISPECIES: serine hydrolase domain-containing protein [unclassified Oceanispirochaeta]MBF9016823.1 beta-lactamase family protein [Oceanispirochaeta sp. M2]NPD73186.1 beta-lactamase family protein [Oceanispirochaeta sp. M1]RDG31054.1 class A beta-lactamase-related serine hydrolase [Oceanispirochaeta sp. M1]